MGILDLFKRKKKSPVLSGFPKASPDPMAVKSAVLWEELSPETALPIWNDPDGITFTDQHISTPGTYIITEVKYVPSGRNVLCRVRTLDDSPEEFTRLTVPQEIRTAEAFLDFIRNSGSAAWFMSGYTMPEHIKATLERVL